MSDEQRYWLRVGERTLRTAGYWMLAAAGAAALVTTPVTIQAALGSTMVIVWGCFLLLGGVATAIASMLERFLVEYAAIPFVLTGVMLYLAALWSITVDGEIGRLTQTTVITAYVLHLGARWMNLRALIRAVART